MKIDSRFLSIKKKKKDKDGPVICEAPRKLDMDRYWENLGIRDRYYSK